MFTCASQGVLSCLPQQSEPCQSGRIPQWACRLRPLSPTPKEPLAYRATPSFGLLKPPYEVVFDLFCSARKADLSKVHLLVALRGFNRSGHVMHNAQRRFILSVGVFPP